MFRLQVVPKSNGVCVYTTPRSAPFSFDHVFREHSDRTTDMDIIEYATFRFDTVEVENGL